MGKSLTQQAFHAATHHPLTAVRLVATNLQTRKCLNAPPYDGCEWLLLARITGAWSKGKYKHYAYYRCMTRGCSQKSKSVARAKLEGGFEDILKHLQPSNRLLDLAVAMFKDSWNSRLKLALASRDEWRRQAEAADKSLLELIDRMVERWSREFGPVARDRTH